ncbi:MAG: cytochrome c biogenesis CcdA family protein, partial [Anaerolineae bacterium]
MRILFVALACLFLLALSVEAKPATSGLESAQAPTNNLLLMAPLAFLAGILSFLSPCTLPLLPAYFAFTFQSGKREIAAMTVSFFLGLATIFVLLGASATLL